MLTMEIYVKPRQEDKEVNFSLILLVQWADLHDKHPSLPCSEADRSV